MTCEAGYQEAMVHFMADKYHQLCNSMSFNDRGKLLDNIKDKLLNELGWVVSFPFIYKKQLSNRLREFKDLYILLPDTAHKRGSHTLVFLPVWALHAIVAPRQIEPLPSDDRIIESLDKIRKSHRLQAQFSITDGEDEARVLWWLLFGNDSEHPVPWVPKLKGKGVHIVPLDFLEHVFTTNEFFNIKDRINSLTKISKKGP